MVSVKRFVVERKKLLKEHANLMYKRLTLNKQIRQVQKDMDGWDRALMNDEKVK